MDLEKETASGGAHHRICEDTGKPYWELWGEGWKDSEDMSPNEVMKMDPRSFPPGTRIVVISIEAYAKGVVTGALYRYRRFRGQSVTGRSISLQMAVASGFVSLQGHWAAIIIALVSRPSRCLASMSLSLVVSI